MCVYCNIGDHPFRFDPPWDKDSWPYRPQPLPQPASWVNPWPTIPSPVDPTKDIKPWSLERLREYLDLLKQVKALEDQVGCPCEPNKADYIKLFEKRIAELEKQAKAKRK